MKIDPPDNLKPFVESYNLLEWEKNNPDVFLPAWTNNFLFFKYDDNSDVELSNGKKLKGYHIMVTGCMTYALRFVKENISAAMIAVNFKAMTLYTYLKRSIVFLTNNSVYAEKIFSGSENLMNKINGSSDLDEGFYLSIIF